VYLTTQKQIGANSGPRPVIGNFNMLGKADKVSLRNNKEIQVHFTFISSIFQIMAVGDGAVIH
jgi:hypothetical protein